MKTIPITPQTCNLKTLAGWYGVCSKTMSKRLKKIAAQLEDRKGQRLFFVKDVEIIFNHYGVPKTILQ
ncbi:MAG: hypothetical protein H0W73_04945 [Bacteroidetes bacterium]|nr:hypothetical protein [Bacteroidota bacterium]